MKTLEYSATFQYHLDKRTSLEVFQMPSKVEPYLREKRIVYGRPARVGDE